MRNVGGTSLSVYSLALAATLLWATTVVAGERGRVVYHMAAPGGARMMLAEASRRLDHDPSSEIVMVVSGEGVTLLAPEPRRWRGPRLDKQVSALVHRGVRFQVCARSLAARNIPKEQVLASAEYVPSGLVQLVRLEEEGFHYVGPASSP